MSNAAVAALAEPWRELWNGDLTLTDQIIHPDFVAHAAPITGGAAGDINGRDALNAWVGGINALFPDLDFAFDVGPFTDGDHLVVRWKAQGTYAGGFPGASAEAIGNRVVFYGTDTLRVEDGQLVEYWANADSLWFLQQLGVTQLPPLS
jgi:predicted ester cyclase